MKISSLGYSSDLLFARFDGFIRDAGAYTVVETPSNPRFHWGNFLIFPTAPRNGDLARWREIFRREIPAVEPLAFGWDDAAAPDPAELAGFKLDENVVLSAAAAAIRPPAHPNRDV